jgi:hypothetical protein
MTITVRPGLELHVLVFPARAAFVWRYLGVVVARREFSWGNNDLCV